MTTTYQLDFAQTKVKSYDHQKTGTVKLFENRYFFLADEMGAGKTKQSIDAAQFLYQHGLINRVLVVCPASVRSVWFDPQLGELKKYLWDSQAGEVYEYHAKTRRWLYGEKNSSGLQWLITNYEFIRARARMDYLLKTFCGDKTLLILDESTSVKNYKALQTRACKTLRNRCGRIILLNGTPIDNNPGDLYSQCDLLSPSVLNCKTWFHFRARYALMGGWQQKQIVGWINMSDLQKRMAPFVLRRLKKDCLDLPEKLPPVTITFPLSEKNWGRYKQMKNDLIAWFQEGHVSIAGQAVVKVMRLAQITSGFLGGIEDQTQFDEPNNAPPEPKTEEIGREKLDGFIEWLKQILETEPNAKLLVFGRFAPEMRRASEAVKDLVPGFPVGLIIGGQSRTEREAAIKLLDPDSAPIGPCVVFATSGSGARGLNLAAAYIVVYLSNSYRMGERQQSEDRVHRPGQKRTVHYFDFVATGPQGQKTIDHDIINTLRKKEDIANRTQEAWVQRLKEE
jgi:hypothetical protein